MRVVCALQNFIADADANSGCACLVCLCIVTLVEVTKEKDTYMNIVPVANGLLNVIYDIDIQGLDTVTDEPSIYAINHLRFADSIIVAGIVAKHIKRPVRFGAKSEYFDGEGINGKGLFGGPVKKFMLDTHQLRVERESKNPRSFEDLKRQARLVLGSGDSLAFHPEGSRSTDGRLNKFKSGIARIALENNVPIVPVGLVYEDHPGFERTDVSVIFGDRLDPNEYVNPPISLLPNREKAEVVSDIAEERVALLTGQIRSHEFADLQKAA